MIEDVRIQLGVACTATAMVTTRDTVMGEAMDTVKETATAMVPVKDTATVMDMDMGIPMVMVKDKDKGGVVVGIAETVGSCKADHLSLGPCVEEEEEEAKEEEVWL